MLRGVSVLIQTTIESGFQWPRRTSGRGGGAEVPDRVDHIDCVTHRLGTGEVGISFDFEGGNAVKA